MFRLPSGLYFSTCLGSLFLSILCTCCSHFFWYCFISFTIFCAPIFFLIHWLFSLSNFVIPSRKSIIIIIMCWNIRLYACSGSTFLSFVSKSLTETKISLFAIETLSIHCTSSVSFDELCQWTFVSASRATDPDSSYASRRALMRWTAAGSLGACQRWEIKLPLAFVTAKSVGKEGGSGFSSQRKDSSAKSHYREKEMDIWKRSWSLLCSVRTMRVEFQMQGIVQHSKGNFFIGNCYRTIRVCLSFPLLN